VHHELRAILDRFIYEHAGVRHLLSAAPPEADTRVLEASGWTTTQLVGHFAVAQEGYVEAASRWLAGEPVASRDLDPDFLNAETIPLLAASSRAEVLDRYAASLRALFALFHQVSDLQFEGPFGPATANRVLTGWSQHQLTHIFPFVKVLPETRYDPVIVNWLARSPVPNEETVAQQREYINDVREYYARLAKEEGGDNE
jgi:hypothetical protein